MDSSPKEVSDEIQREDANCLYQIPSRSNGETVDLFSSRKGLLQSSGPLAGMGIKTPEQKKPKRKFLGLLIRPPRRAGFLKLSSPTILVSPSETFHRIASERDGISRATPTEPIRGLREGFNMPFVGEVRWAVLKETTKAWLRNPKNLALLAWGSVVAVSGAILFLVMIGLLDRALPDKSQRDAWFEVNNQIINALFTLMCLYQHPQRCYHLALLYRWKQEDIVKLRKIYCKNGTYKPHEWAHMMVVVMLLQLNCFAQYALCGLNWGYKRSDRPALGVGLCLAFAIGAPAAAGLYVMLSPLGKDYDTELDLEAGIMADTELAPTNNSTATGKPVTKLLEKRYSFIARESKRMEPKPEWKGGLCDFWSDPKLAFFSTFCGFCVFGWNMDRLGFGNMYVHIVTFILLCMAPFWIFNLAAINIDNVHVREALGITGIILCVFGTSLRGILEDSDAEKIWPTWEWIVFGQPNVTDCMQWLFCSLCSLCQEVRTGDFYELCDNKLYPKQHLSQNSPGMAGSSPGLAPLHCETRSPALFSPPANSPIWVYSGQSPLNARASISSMQGPMHSVGSSPPSQGQSPVKEGSPVYMSNSPMSETHIQHSLAPESGNVFKEAEEMEKLETGADPMTAPIPLTLQREQVWHSKSLHMILLAMVNETVSFWAPCFDS